MWKTRAKRSEAKSALLRCARLMGAAPLLRSVRNGRSFAAFYAQLTLCTFFSVFCVAPMSFFRSLDALKFTSAMALVFIVFMCVTVVMYSADVDGLDPCEKFELPDFVPNVDDDGVCKGSIYATTDWGKTLSTLPIFIFSFTCHQNIFSVVSELNPNTILRVDKVIFISIYGAMALYMLVAYRGYFTYGDEVEGDIINK